MVVPWTAMSEPLRRGRAMRMTIERAGAPMLYADVIEAWRLDREFRAAFVGLLAGVPFAAFRWETPPITIANVRRPFEFVVLDAPGLVVPAAAGAFSERFRASDADQVIDFPSLGHDAILVVPCPRGPQTAYSHLAEFVRAAPDEQQQALWQHVGAAMQRRLGHRPVWLSTAGAGVAWLHVRLDDRPKYYWHEPYRVAA